MARPQLSGHASSIYPASPPLQQQAAPSSRMYPGASSSVHQPFPAAPLGVTPLATGPPSFTTPSPVSYPPPPPVLAATATAAVSVPLPAASAPSGSQHGRVVNVEMSLETLRKQLEAVTQQLSYSEGQRAHLEMRLLGLEHQRKAAASEVAARTESELKRLRVERVFGERAAQQGGGARHDVDKLGA